MGMFTRLFGVKDDQGRPIEEGQLKQLYRQSLSIAWPWNGWFDAFIYLNDRDLYPLQLILRDILIVSNIDPTTIDDPDLIERLEYTRDLVKYALIVVSSVPMMLLYPFVQKYFIRGVMIGSLKG